MAGLFILTGANSGLGLETARLLAAESAGNTVILACRNLGKAARAAHDITSTTGNKRIRTMELDLCSLGSVRAFISEFDAQLDDPIEALVCNAGISRGPALTLDGMDSVFETNHLGHFLLTLSLLERMAPAARVVSVSSDMHQPPGPRLRWPGAEQLAHPRSGVLARGLRYSYSKLCNLYFTYELSRRLRDEGSERSAAAFNPGLMTDTNFVATPGPIAAIMKRMFASRVGSLPSSSAALAQLSSGHARGPIDGQYFDRTALRPSRSSPLSYDAQNARDLWRISAELTGIGA